MLLDDRALTAGAARIDALLEQVETLPDPAVRASATEFVQGMMLLYGEGLARMLAVLQEGLEPTASERIRQAFAADELVAHLLLLHDLHPITVEERVSRALAEVRPYLQSHGGNVELVAVDGGIARLRLQGSCSGCPSSTMTLTMAVEKAIKKAAPDIDGMDVEGLAPPPPPGFVPVEALLRKERAPAGAGGAWTTVNGVADLPEGRPLALEVAGVPALFLKLDGTYYAYQNVCASCRQTLEHAALSGATLTCAACRHRYDVRRAGRSLDAADVHLEPIPLLVQDGVVRVAVGAVSGAAVGALHG